MYLSVNEGIEELSELSRTQSVALFAGHGFGEETSTKSQKDLYHKFLEFLKTPLLLESFEDELQQTLSSNQACERILQNSQAEITKLNSKIRTSGLNDIKLVKSLFIIWLSDLCNSRTIRDLCKVAVGTNYSNILTAGYDLDFEMAAAGGKFFDLAKSSFSFKDDLDILPSISSDSSSIIHLFGAVPDNLFLDEFLFSCENYVKSLNRLYDGFPFALRMVFTRNTTLFVGFAPGDPEFDCIFDIIDRYFPSGVLDTYSLPLSYVVFDRSYSEREMKRAANRLRTKIILADGPSEVEQLLLSLQNTIPRLKKNGHQRSHERGSIRR